MILEGEIIVRVPSLEIRAFSCHILINLTAAADRDRHVEQDRRERREHHPSVCAGKAAEGTRVTLGIANHDHGSEIDPRPPPPPPPSSPGVKDSKRMGTPSPPPVPLLPPQGPSFAGWSLDGPAGVTRRHPVLCAFAFSLLFFMGVEFTIPMVPSTSPPLDLGFIATKPLNRALATAPTLNTLLAALNTYQLVKSASSLGQSMPTSDSASPAGFKVQASLADFKS
ncbi:hypothetical protein GW17_00036099 [Ensete ventricosum]|nr:hypothetical protein GW17_00036099 [Ensete ventricosum]